MYICFDILLPNFRFWSFSILLWLSLSLLGLVAQSDNLDDLFFVEILEASGGDYILIVFLCKE